MRKIAIVILLAIGLNVVNAQDIIITKDSKKINAKVTEINENDIRYKKYENLDGPSYSMKKSEIASILYENGDVEVFNTNVVPQTAPQYNSNYSTDDFKKAKGLRNAGISCFSVGLATWVIGSGLFGLNDEYVYNSVTRTGFYAMSDAALISGITLSTIGGATTITGIIMWAVGQNRMNRFNTNGYSLFENEKMQLNLAVGTNSMGLKLNLR